MNRKRFANIILIVLVVILAGALGYVTLVKKPASTEQLQPNSSQNTQLAPLPSLPTTCTDQQEATPVITSISPASGPVGTKVQIRGCNFTGFEGDLDAVFVRSDGAEIPLYGGTWSPGYGGAERGKLIMVTVQSYCASGSETGRYSGITSSCKTVQATPGVYRVYVTAWGKKSNAATFTIK